MTPLRLFFLSLTFLIASPVWLAAGKLLRGPYLQQATSNSVVVVWRTEGESAPLLRYGNSPGALTMELGADAIVLRVSADINAAANIPRLYKEPVDEIDQREADHDPSTVPNTYQYEAQVSQLQPDSKYFYAIYDGDKLLAGGDEHHYFQTHRRIGSATDMRIWVVGDSGNGGRNQAMVHEAMQAYVLRTDRLVDHYIHVGDMAYSDGTDREFQDHFFAPYQSTLRNTVCWPAMGNHEGHTSRGISGIGPYYDAYVVPTRAEVGGAASGTEAYYSFDIEEVHFICLDSHDLDRSPDSAMAQWLRADLEQAKAKWLVAFWHHPPYTMGSHNSDRESQLIEMRENFMPILEAGGVDLTLTGHSHIYERSMLMDGAYVTPTTAHGVILDDGDGRINGDGAYRKSKGLQPHEGSVSIVAGHGGAGISREGTMPVMREIILENGSVLLDIQGDTLTGTMLNKHGQIRDIFNIVKWGKVFPIRVKNPWQPIHDISLLTEIWLNFAGAADGAMPKDWRVESGNRTGLAVATQANATNFLKARANEVPLTGLYAQWELNAPEIETKFRLLGENRKGAGLVLGYRDAKNFHRIFFDSAADIIRVSRFVNGVETLLREENVRIPSDQWLNAEIEVSDGELQVQFQDDEEQEREVEFEIKLDAEFPKGLVGFYLPANGAAEFQFFALKDNARP
jgi:hypothetical protein